MCFATLWWRCRLIENWKDSNLTSKNLSKSFAGPITFFLSQIKLMKIHRLSGFERLNTTTSIEFAIEKVCKTYYSGLGCNFVYEKSFKLIMYTNIRYKYQFEVRPGQACCSKHWKIIFVPKWPYWSLFHFIPALLNLYILSS
jgi:hypothetical protein